MCGIIGVACYKNSGMILQHRNMFEDLLIFDSVRGIDGTGVMKVMKSGDVKIIKIDGHPFYLYETNEYKKFMELPHNDDVTFLIGHNRFATFGAKTEKEAHPFIAGDIVLVHNGTINNWRTLNKENYKYDVDSHALAGAINERGIVEALADIKGSYSIVYYNKKDKTINLIRNDERPMWIGQDEGNGVFAFGSELNLIFGAGYRNGIIIKPIIPTKPMTLYTLPLDKLELIISDKEEEIKKIVKAKNKIAAANRPRKQGKKKQRITLKRGTARLPYEYKDSLYGLQEDDKIIVEFDHEESSGDEKDTYLVYAFIPNRTDISIQFLVKGKDKLTAVQFSSWVQVTCKNFMEADDSNEPDIIWVKFEKEADCIWTQEALGEFEKDCKLVNLLAHPEVEKEGSFLYPNDIDVSGLGWV